MAQHYGRRPVGKNLGQHGDFGSPKQEGFGSPKQEGEWKTPRRLSDLEWKAFPSGSIFSEARLVKLQSENFPTQILGKNIVIGVTT